jgi:hypothetical protein
MVDVERELGVRVRLDTMFERGATVAGMAAVIEGAAAKAPLDVIGASEDGRAALPYLFFVQPDESTMLTLRHFTRSLAPGHRVVGLLPERVNGRFKRSTTIEQLAGPLVADSNRRDRTTLPASRSAAFWPTRWPAGWKRRASRWRG